jgi:ketosteroid isomerase-like protein
MRPMTTPSQPTCPFDRASRAARRFGAAIACIATLTACATGAPESAPESLLRAERAFAAMAAAQGVRASFLANFADDGIAFEPGPVRLRETWHARPAPADPLALRLQWEPAAAAVAASGELGFTTGPFTLSFADGARPPRHGIYTSVWRRDAAGPWKVVVDAGVGTPEAINAAELAPAPALPAGTALAPSPAAIERGGAMTASSGFAAQLAADARWYRDDEAPRLRRAGIDALLAAAPMRMEFVPAAEAFAGSRDFGYTYGRLVTATDGGATTHRSYVHLWARDGAGAWRIAVAIWLAPEDR